MTVLFLFGKAIAKRLCDASANVLIADKSYNPKFNICCPILTSLVSGVAVLIYPELGAIMLTVLFPIWFISHCISRLMQIHHIRFVAGDSIYVFTLVVNIIGIILGFMMLLSPLFTLSAIRCFAGCYLILLGVEDILTAISRMGR